jgi:hypothetical protein
MQHNLFTKLLIALGTFAFGLTIFSLWGGFQKKAFSSSELRPRSDFISVSVNSIGFYGWGKEKTRDDEVMDVTHVDDLKASLPNDYRKLRVWDAGDRLAPELIEIRCRLENRGQQPLDLLVLATGDYLVAPFKKGAVDEKGALKSFSLTEHQNLGQQAVIQLRPGEVREISYTDINVKSVVDKYRLKEYGQLWPFDLRVRVSVETTDNIPVTESDARLRIMPNLIW